MRKSYRIILKVFKALVITSGCLLLIYVILAFTTIPFHIKHWLGTHKGIITEKPAVIVLMGGSGMPSEDGLLRTYYTYLLATRYPGAEILIALPGNPEDSTDSPYLMKQELILRGIEPGIIKFENNGRNTRQQAIKVAEIYQDHNRPIALVTSSEHMYRAIRCFEKVGFKEVKGFPTFSVSISDDKLMFNDRELKGNKGIPPIGHNKQFRYQFWNHLIYEIQVSREGFALLYYRLRSWI